MSEFPTLLYGQLLHPAPLEIKSFDVKNPRYE